MSAKGFTPPRPHESHVAVRNRHGKRHKDLWATASPGQSSSWKPHRKTPHLAPSGFHGTVVLLRSKGAFFPMCGFILVVNKKELRGGFARNTRDWDLGHWSPQYQPVTQTVTKTLPEFGRTAWKFGSGLGRLIRTPHGTLTEVGILAQLLAVADHALPQQPLRLRVAGALHLPADLGHGVEHGELGPGSWHRNSRVRDYSNSPAGGCQHFFVAFFPS